MGFLLEVFFVCHQGLQKGFLLQILKYKREDDWESLARKNQLRGVHIKWYKSNLSLR